MNECLSASVAYWLIAAFVCGGKIKARAPCQDVLSGVPRLPNVASVSSGDMKC